MSRWIDKFKEYGLQKRWNDLKNSLELSEADKVVIESVEELARLKKVVAFMDNAFQGIDPELVSEIFLSEFSNNSEWCTNEINNYNENKNIEHIKNANEHIDNLLNYMRPYIIHSGKLKKSLLDSVNAYTNEVNKNLVNIADTEKEYKKVQEFRQEIEKYYALLFSDDADNENESIKLQISTFLKSTKEKYEKINTFYNETLSDNEENSTKAKIIEAKKDVLGYTKEANDKLIDTSAKIDKLKKFYVEIFGSQDDNEVGLEEQLKKDRKTLEDLQVKQEEVHKTLRAKIENLLTGATNTGLAKAYQDMKESFKLPIKNWNYIFMGSIAIMIVFSFLSLVEIGVTENNVTTWFSFVKIANFSDIINSLLSKLPLYIPLAWIAIFASKRVSEYRRLEQEYAHKEAMAKSYMSYKKQIESLEKDTNKELLAKLLNSSIDILSHNASESLDKKYDSSAPTEEMVKTLMEKIEKLKS